ncbi:hypothetical protein SAMN04487783_2102 [Agrococcus baldri]|uniref:Uncharacterized protein n=1 Tax=Agrococcus baldri TaxID=153730 RepID=A0AA94HNP6_9MICO|nr:hypothetical protein [Agrococcus baldri]SFS15684.1 hypothetical protein SAMN04487783_2102 [Agrococcus baldri]
MINDNPGNLAAELRDLKRRIRQLETASPLAHSSISHGTGLAVNIPAGIHMEGDGSATAGAAFLDSTGGGRVGSGASFFRNDGALTNSNGTLPVAVNMTGAANLTFEGEVRGRLGVVGPIDGVQTELGAAVKEADRKGQSGYDNAMAARGEASDADAKAQSAWNLANAKATTASVAAVQSDLDNVKDGTSPISPTLYGPQTKLSGLGQWTGGVTSTVRLLAINTSTGALMYMSNS